MNVTKIIKATAVRGRASTAAPIIKEDYGLYLLIGGIDLPEVYEVDFSNEEHAGTSVTMIGNADGVLIPTQFIKSGKDVFAFYYHVGEDFGRTLYTIRIPNKLRPDRTDEEPTPEEQRVIDQAISALNTAVAKTAQDVISADQSARSASGDADRAERARTGAETAQGKAEEAQESAERAKDDAETSERNASESERIAKGYAETASEKADSIHSMTASAQTLPAGSSASASYDAQTGVMSFGIPKGKDGTDGDDGYSPTANVSKSGKTATITITDKNGTTSAQVEDGEDGTDGIDGISPSVSVTDITGGHRVVITDKDGAKSFDVEDGATGATPNLTIGTVETLEPTESATATITGTPENPVLNLGIPQGEQGEVTLEDYYKAFPTDTASGAIVSFSDGADNLPLKSLVVDINPVQDLSHGDPSPENLCPISGWTSVGVEQRGVNLLSFNGREQYSGGDFNPNIVVDFSKPYVYYGIASSGYLFANNVPSDVVISSDNCITFTPRYNWYGVGFNIPIKGGATYSTNANVVSGYAIGVAFYDSDSKFISTTNVRTFTAPSNAVNAIVVFSARADVGTISVENARIVYGNNTSAEYEPYSGMNIEIDLGQTVYGGKLDVLSGVLTIDRVFATKKWGQMSTVYNGETHSTKSLNFDANVLKGGQNSITNITATYIEATTAQSTHYYVGSNLKTVYVVLPNDTNTDVDIQVCGTLEEPIEIQLTPHEVNSLLGVNNIFADTGDTVCEYRADTKTWIQRKIAEAISALS